MELGVGVRGPEQVAGVEKLAMARQVLLQAIAAGLVDSLSGQADGQPFEHGARLEDLDRLAVADLPYARAAVRLLVPQRRSL